MIQIEKVAQCVSTLPNQHLLAKIQQYKPHNKFESLGPVELPV